MFSGKYQHILKKYQHVFSINVNTFFLRFYGFVILLCIP